MRYTRGERGSSANKLVTRPSLGCMSCMDECTPTKAMQLPCTCTLYNMGCHVSHNWIKVCICKYQEEYINTHGFIQICSEVYKYRGRYTNAMELLYKC